MDAARVTPAASADPARWLLDAPVGWARLVTFGPPGFDVYVRVAFEPPDAPEAADGPPDAAAAVLAVLAGRTSTPDEAFAAVWEGWGAQGPVPDAPRVPVPNRELLLLAGPVSALRDAPAVGWAERDSSGPPPHLAWPADRAWCLACDVDEEVELTVGCTRDTAAALEAALPGQVRRVRYGEAVPPYHDEPAPGPAHQGLSSPGEG